MQLSRFNGQQSQLIIPLVIRDAEFSEQFGATLWSALIEAEQLFAPARRGRSMTRMLLSPHIPDSARRDMQIAGIRDMTALGKEIGERSFWDGLRGKFRRCVDQHELATRLRSVLSSSSLDLEGTMLVVTDQEITPPPEWRYVIAAEVSGGGVISAAPTDPHYWGEPVSDGTERARRIKQRVRAMTICAIGEVLGLSRCDNASCFMFSNIDSVSRLDDMVVMGVEHGLPRLTGRGFPLSPSTPPELIENVVNNEAADNL